MFDQVPFNWFEAIGQSVLAEFNFNVSRILLNTHIAIVINQIDHDKLFNYPSTAGAFWRGADYMVKS